MIHINSNGDILIHNKPLVGINFKPTDSISKILVLAANAVRIVEKQKKLGGSKR
jgi:hypothetical protein